MVGTRRNHATGSRARGRGRGSLTIVVRTTSQTSAATAQRPMASPLTRMSLSSHWGGALNPRSQARSGMELPEGGL